MILSTQEQFTLVVEWLGDGHSPNLIALPFKAAIGQPLRADMKKLLSENKTSIKMR